MAQLTNPLAFALYGGIAGVKLPNDRFELGQGIVLQRTYCHVFAPFMAAFNPASPGQPHPPPWRAISGGIGFDLHCEIYVPLDVSNVALDRLNLIWWLVALLRLSGSPLAIIPVVANHSFSQIASLLDEPVFWPVELMHRRLHVGEGNSTKPVGEQLDWVHQHWQAGAALMNENADFGTAFQAFDACTGDRTPSVALISLWGALERLFSPAQQELTFRVSANIAAYLEPPGENRLALFKSIKKLYGERSKAAHGADTGGHTPFIDTYLLVRRVLTRMIERRHVPNRDELETRLFSDCE